MAVEEQQEVSAPKGSEGQEVAPPATPEGRLFVVIDDTDASLTSWRSAQQQCIKAGDAVTLITAVEVNTTWIGLAEAAATSRAVARDIEQQQVTAAKEGARELIRKHKAEASPEGCTVDSIIVTARNTSVGPALVRFLEETQTENAQVLVPAAEELSFFEKVWAWLTDDWPVSDYLVRNAPCRVQVVPSTPLVLGEA